ncbi:hypothetical protein L2735_11700 [Shewanella olleyana]|uniref:hypothetical protein n=1 Tax=Shewanella olleyana TaxID=135626 RepID=UPI00200EBF44|nr:hypothetical protein [Shewanella olleyana]MCL1067466.1 hypothetical protein [Shewanella olleyana]
MKKTIMLTSMIFLGGCTAEETSTYKEKNSNSASEKVRSTNASLLNSSENSISTAKIERQKHDVTYSNNKDSLPVKPASYSVALNQQKFITDNASIKAGQSLFNMEMKQYGVVKGSFVVIASKKPKWLESDFSINEIAKLTYRLNSQSADADLHEWYKKLIQDARFSTVELEIDYSGKSDVPEF